MPNQHSPHTALFHLFLFFSFKVSHIYLPMLSRHLKISKPIWHYLHHRRPLKFASVEWVWQAITPMQDIGNLTRICYDKSGRSGEASPEGWGWGAAESRPAALQKKTWGLMQWWEARGYWECPKKPSLSQIHANIQQICQNIHTEERLTSSATQLNSCSCSTLLLTSLSL